MRLSAGFAACLLVPAALLGASLSFFDAAAKPESTYRIVAGAPVKKKPPNAPPGSTISRTNLQGLSIAVEFADANRRAEFLKTFNPQEKDPFAASPGVPERYLTFVVSFDNQTPKDVTFQPGNVALVADRGQQAFPLDVTDFYMLAERSGVDNLQPVIDHITRVLFDSSTTIRSGGRATRLLAFRPLDGKWQQFKIHFSFLQIGSETHTLSFPFSKDYLED